MSDSAIAIVSALLGALAGGLISFFVAARTARRERRARYGEGLVDALATAHHAVDDAVAAIAGHSGATSGTAADEPLVLREEANWLWVQAELAGTLELTRSRRSAMQAWALNTRELLIEGRSTRSELEDLERHLDLSLYLVVAWIARAASGADFDLSAAEVEERFGADPRQRRLPDRIRWTSTGADST